MRVSDIPQHLRDQWDAVKVPQSVQVEAYTIFSQVNEDCPDPWETLQRAIAVTEPYYRRAWQTTAMPRWGAN